MLIIRHLSGPRAGEEDRIDPKVDRVVFGRGRDCQVAYPPEETIISREHFALVRKPPGPTGHWTIELFGNPFVAVNGVAADPGQRAANDAIFELGKTGGPSFKLLIEADPAADNLPLTAEQEPVEGLRVVVGRVVKAAAQAGRAAGLAGRIALVGLATAVAVGVGTGYYYVKAQRVTIGSEVREQLARAAFLVEAPTPVGTAWPVGPHLLATNSHVAELYKPGENMLALSPGKDGKAYEIIGAKLHPGYNALSAFLARDPIQRNYVQLFVPGYDVALLQVKDELPASAILKLASTDELRALEPGTAVAITGYPMEGVIGSRAQGYGATPELHVGTITGLTDFFFLPADFEHRQLIHHDLPTAGGSSGSPIVGGGGHVVALLNAGNSYSPGPNQPRVPSGVLINYGQRVDMLRQLLDGDADREIAEDQQYWERQIRTFPTAPDIAASIVLAKIRDSEKNGGINLIKVSDETSTLSQKMRVKTHAGSFQRQEIHQVKISAGAEYVFIAIAYGGSPLQLWVYRGTEPIGHDSEESPLAWFRYVPAYDVAVNVRVICPEDTDVTYTLQVLKVQTPAAAG
jgi:hypothetical protein